MYFNVTVVTLAINRNTYINIILLKNWGIFFLYRENLPPQDAEIGHRNPLKQTNKVKRVS